MARLERGDRPPRLDTLLRIANALDCELDVGLRPRAVREDYRTDLDAHRPATASRRTFTRARAALDRANSDVRAARPVARPSWA